MKDIELESLDSLLKINDDLIKLDSEMESFLKGLEKLGNELTNNKFILKVHIKNSAVEVEKGIPQFQWDSQKFPIKNSVENLMKRIVERLEASKSTINQKKTDYNKNQEELKNLTKCDSEAASLIKVDYRQILKKSKKEMITTDYLRPVICFVPKYI
jgi:hypothetical protein